MSNIRKKVCTFAPDFGHQENASFASQDVKRESGENPEQSRCCMLIKKTKAATKKQECHCVLPNKTWEGCNLGE